MLPEPFHHLCFYCLISVFFHLESFFFTCDPYLMVWFVLFFLLGLCYKTQLCWVFPGEGVEYGQVVLSTLL